MTKQQWARIRHFDPCGSDQFGDPFAMDLNLVLLLDSFRHSIRRKCLVTSGTQGTHTPSSYHYKGLAIDFVIDCNGFSKLDLFLELTRFPFTGIGIYPDWTWENRSDSLGVHVDCRPLPNDYRASRWLRVFCENDKRIKEFPITDVVLQRFEIM